MPTLTTPDYKALIKILFIRQLCEQCLESYNIGDPANYYKLVDLNNKIMIKIGSTKYSELAFNEKCYVFRIIKHIFVAYHLYLTFLNEDIYITFNLPPDIITSGLLSGLKSDPICLWRMFIQQNAPLPNWYTPLQSKSYNLPPLKNTTVNNAKIWLENNKYYKNNSTNSEINSEINNLNELNRFTNFNELNRLTNFNELNRLTNSNEIKNEINELKQEIKIVHNSITNLTLAVNSIGENLKDLELA